MEKKKFIAALMVCCTMLSAKAADYTITDNVIPDGINPNNNAGIAEVANGDTLTITNSTFSGNSGAYSGGVYLHNGGILNITGGSKVGEEVQNATSFSGNHNNIYWAGGGAIYSTSGSTVNVGDYTSFTGNYTNNNSLFSGEYVDGGDSGGAIYAMDSTLNIGNNVTISGNYATNKEVVDPQWGAGSNGGLGGGIFLQNSNAQIGDDFKVENNQSRYQGGGLSIYGWGDNETIEIGENAKFINNKTLESVGGAVSNIGAQLTIEKGAEFQGNEAATQGGAIYNRTDLVLKGATFTENKAAAGGALYNAGTASLSDVTFKAAANGATNDIYNADGEISTAGTNYFYSDINGTGSIENSGKNLLAGNNSGYTGIYSHSSENAVTTVTGTFFGGESYFNKGTLNWDTQVDYEGKLTVSGDSILNIGETQTNVLNLRKDSSIAGSVATAIKEGSTLNIIGGEATLDSNDSWEGKIVLGTDGLEGDTSTLNVGLAEGSTIGKLEANNGTLNVLDGLNLDIGEGSYIKEAVAVTTNGNINIIDGGEITIGDNYTLNGGAKVTLTDGGIVNYARENDASTIIEADGGHLNLLSGSKLTLTSGSNIQDAVALDIRSGSQLTLKEELDLNLSNEDTWNGKIVNKNGRINANNVTRSSETAALEQTGTDGELNLYNDSTITLGNNSTIEGGQINITKGNDGSKGSVLTIVNTNITGGDMTIDEDSSFVVKSGTFQLDTLTSSNLVDVMNNEINKSSIGTLTADGQADFNIDIHARSNYNRSNDQFVVTNPVAGDGVVNINDWSLQGDIFGWDAPIDRRIVLDHIFVDENGNPLEGVIEATDKETFTPIGWYELKRNAVSGVNYSLDLVKFNPQVFRGQVATVAQWMNQLAIDDMLFTHSMVLPSFKEENGKMANNYAAINPLFGPYQYSIKDGGLWYKMYGTFEHLQMNNNLRVGNNSYGALIGADFGMKDLKNGWKFMPTAYVGYNGAHQYWSGMGQYQNGCQAGLMGTWYKDNFIVGGLVYGGVYENSMDVHGTTDNTFNYFAGASTKASYNIRLHRDWVLQPNLMAAYNYFGQQNWHSDFGQMGMMAGMLHGVNIAPGVNLIWEKETFSAYATLQYMYNINGACGGRAGNVGLPQVEMERGYIQYGLGFTKKFTDRASGYLQAVLRNVGRTGVGFQAGFNIRLGK